MKQNSTKKLLSTSLLLVLIALVSLTAATAAWMTIADSTRLKTMRLDVTSGANLRFDLDSHETFEEYVKSLRLIDIADRILRDQGYHPRENPLSPVTTTDCIHFTLENGEPAAKESYMEFVLHFMATDDMVVHLTTAGEEGTRIFSDEVSDIAKAMRISFTADDSTAVYDPGMEQGSEEGLGGKIFGLARGNRIVYDASNTLFFLKAGVDKPVTVRIWLEGTDEICTDALRGVPYHIQLRFVGTDENGNLLEDSRTTTRRSAAATPTEERNENK